MENIELIKQRQEAHWLRFYFIVSSLFFSLAIASGLRADENIHDLGEILVTGVKKEIKEKIAITALAEVIELDKQETTETIQRLQDLFNYMPGVDMIRTSTVTEAADPLKLRGFGSKRMAILLDGRPLNKTGCMGSSNIDWASLSLESVEKVVVVRGGCTALYGGAIGGVINIITRKKLKSSKKGYEGNLSAEVASYDTKVGKGYAMGNLGPFILSLGANHSETDGYLRNNYFESSNFTGRLLYDLTTDGQITLGYKYGDMEKGIPTALRKLGGWLQRCGPSRIGSG